MWEFIDKIIYINLDHREDRREHMKRFFEEGGIPCDKIIRFPAITYPVGAVGATKSHIAALELAKRERLKTVLILEDDVCWLNKDTRELRDHMAHDWDVCMIGGNYIVAEQPNRIRVAFSAYAYIVREHYYDTLLQNMYESLYKKLRKIIIPYSSQRYYAAVKNDTVNSFDSYWIKLQQKDKWIGFDLCGHTHMYSDVTNTDAYPDMNSSVHRALTHVKTDEEIYILRSILHKLQ